MSFSVSLCPRPERPQVHCGSRAQDQGCGWSLQLGNLVWATWVLCPRMPPQGPRGLRGRASARSPPRGRVWGRQRALPQPRPARRRVSDAWKVLHPIFQRDHDVATPWAAQRPVEGVGCSSV